MKRPIQVQSPILEIVEYNNKLRTNYLKSLAISGKQVAIVYQNILRKTYAIEEIYWEQHEDIMDRHFSVEAVWIKFDRGLFPINEEVNHDECVHPNGFTPYYRLDELLERGMDIINIKELQDIEDIVEEIKEIHDCILALAPALKEAFGRASKITITKKDIIVDKKY